jgi:predicted DNA-binding transcriptional regulator AlpA
MSGASTVIKPEYLTAEQVEVMTGFSVKALETMRHRRKGPPFLKLGVSVRYRVSDVRAWMEQGAPRQ